jgi:hypothetical protein
MPSNSKQYPSSLSPLCATHYGMLAPSFFLKENKNLTETGLFCSPDTWSFQKKISFRETIYIASQFWIDEVSEN